MSSSLDTGWRWWKGAGSGRDKSIKTGNRNRKDQNKMVLQVEEKGQSLFLGLTTCSPPLYPPTTSVWTILEDRGAQPASVAVFGMECVWWLHLTQLNSPQDFQALAPWSSTFSHTWSRGAHLSLSEVHDSLIWGPNNILKQKKFK